MKRLIVSSIEPLSAVVIVLMLMVGLIGGAGVGYHLGGAALAVVGAILGVIAYFALAVLIFGALFILLEMDESLRAIRALLERQAAPKP